MKSNNELAIIIYSCIKNSDMWEIFSKLFGKYWSTCDYNVILVTDKYIDNCQKYVFDQVIELNENWYSMIMQAIKVANTPYVMLWMDDYLLCDYVDNEIIEENLKVVKKYNAANLRMIESPIIPHKRYKGISTLGYYEPGTAYSMSTQVGIWDVKFLIKYLKSNWSAWDFERLGSIQIKDYRQPLLVSLDFTFPYEEGVRTGKWMDSGIRLCKRNKIKLDYSKRKKMSNLELSWIYFKGCILECSPTLVVKFQNLISLKKVRKITQYFHKRG